MAAAKGGLFFFFFSSGGARGRDAGAERHCQTCSCLSPGRFLHLAPPGEFYPQSRLGVVGKHRGALSGTRGGETGVRDHGTGRAGSDRVVGSEVGRGRGRRGPLSGAGGAVRSAVRPPAGRARRARRCPERSVSRPGPQRAEARESLRAAAARRASSASCFRGLTASRERLLRFAARGVWGLWPACQALPGRVLCGVVSYGRSPASRTADARLLLALPSRRRRGRAPRFPGSLPAGVGPAA